MMAKFSLSRPFVLALCLSLPFALAFSPSAPPLRTISSTTTCTMSASNRHTSSRRSFFHKALGGALVLGGIGAGGADAANAATFEEFMAEKRREEARKEALKSGTPAFVEEDDDVADAPAKVAVDSNAPAKSGMDDYKDLKPEVDVDPVKTLFVKILRVQESTLQQERLIRTGQFKDLQRNNVKLATRMILDNSGISDAITKASGYAVKKDKVNDANEIGREAIEDLRTVIDYFEDTGLKVNEMSQDKKDFVSKALKACRTKLDTFLSYMPTDKVSAARAQVIEENELNLKELPKDMTILNPIFMN